MVDKVERQGKKPTSNGKIPFATAGETAMDFPFKILCYGNSGAGKTYAACTAPKPMVLLTERNGLHSIQASNPGAHVKYCENADDVRDILRMAMNGQLKQYGIKTLVVDSLTEVQRLFVDEIMLAKAQGEDARLSLQDWGTLTERMRRFMRCLRDLDLHVVATALVESQHDDSTGATNVFPAFQGKKLHSEVSQFFNVVGYTFKRESQDSEGKRQIEHKIMLDGPSRFVCKPCGPLTGIRDPNLSDWFTVLNESLSTK